MVKIKVAPFLMAHGVVGGWSPHRNESAKLQRNCSSNILLLTVRTMTKNSEKIEILTSLQVVLIS